MLPLSGKVGSANFASQDSKRSVARRMRKEPMANTTVP